MIKNTRREMLAGLGALTGSTLIGSAAAAEAAVGRTSDPAGSAPGGFRQEEPAPAPATGGMRYVNVAGMQFQPGSWLAVTSGDQFSVGASSINWFGAGQIVSNGTNSQVNAARLIRVWCGGTPDAATHFVIDVTGYYI